MTFGNINSTFDFGDIRTPSTHDKRNGASEPLLEKAGAWSLPRMGCFNHEFDIQNITIV